MQTSCSVFTFQKDPSPWFSTRENIIRCQICWGKFDRCEARKEHNNYFDYYRVELICGCGVIWMDRISCYQPVLTAQKFKRVYPWYYESFDLKRYQKYVGAELDLSIMINSRGEVYSPVSRDWPRLLKNHINKTP